MDLTWLAAVLRPRDVAPHPNFPEPGTQHSAAILAAVVLGEAWMLDRDGPDGLADAHADEAIMVVRRAMQTETLLQSVNQLSAELLRDERPTDAARSCALALLTCAAATELDDSSRCLAILDAQLHWTASGGGADGRLVQAILLQQKALRLLDAGRAHEHTCVSALRILTELDVRACSEFPVSKGVSWTWTETLEQIVLATRDAAYSLLPIFEPNSFEHDGVPIPTWQDLVRSWPVDRLMRIDHDRAEVLSDFVSRLFAGGAGPPAFGYRRGARSDLFYSVLALELLGHGRVYGARKELAELRFLQARQSHDFVGLEDGLRLLRQSGATAELDIAASGLSTAGPLHLLGADARQVLLMRAQPEMLRTVELRVLKTAADLLTPAEAGLGLDIVLAAIEAGVPARLPRQSEIGVVRFEHAWLAAASLANTADRTAVVATLLLQAAAQVKSEDQLLDRAIASAVRELEWATIGAELRDNWRAWLQDDQWMPTTREIVSSLLASTAVRDTGNESELAAIVARLNAAITGLPFEPLEIPAAIDVVRQSLTNIRALAASGTHSMGGISPADVAAGFIVYLHVDELWPDLAEFLSDSAVLRLDRSPAFERLARSTLRVPEAQASYLREHADATLKSADRVWDEELVPYPAALRFFASAGLLREGEAFDYVARLAGMVGNRARREAAETIAILARTSVDPWLVTFALQLSYDADAEVQAQAGRALALLASSIPSLADVSMTRLSKLLDQDGLLVPLLVLRGLSDVGDSLPPNISQQVQRLRVDHPSRRIRRQAALLLDGAT